LDKTIEAIDEGNREQAKAYAQQLWDEGRPLHDLMGDMVALILTYVGETVGEDAVEDALRYTGERLWKPIVATMKAEGVEQLAQIFAAFLRAHGVDFHVEEDEEKFAFVAKYCTSGGRMMKEGKIDTSKRHPFNLGTTKKAYPWSFDQTGVPYYCCHCSLWMQIQSKEWGMDIIEHRFGRQFDDNGNPIDEPCKTFIYKKPRP
jgi:hypothetical protein